MTASSEADRGSFGDKPPSPGESIERATPAQPAEPEAGTPDVGRGLRERPVYVAPRSSAETLLAAIWAEVFQVEEVGIHDDFFALGGSSILSIKVVAMAQERGLRVTPVQLFEHPTIAGLASAIVESTAAGEIQEPRAEPYTDQSRSTAQSGSEGLEASDFHALTAQSIGRIDSHLRELQASLSRIESALTRLPG